MLKILCYMCTTKKRENYMTICLLIVHFVSVVQVGTSVRMKDIAVSCKLLHAPPPPVRLGQEKVPAQSSSFKPTLYSDDTITKDVEDDDEEDDDDGEYSLGDSYDSDDSDESGQGLVLKIFV